ncbi:hypothetical protein MMC20_006076 [Loxospora ochrophaea]|nr:hypothetical protein [Loxospora ochrophaea]
MVTLACIWPGFFIQALSTSSFLQPHGYIGSPLSFSFQPKGRSSPAENGSAVIPAANSTSFVSVLYLLRLSIKRGLEDEPSTGLVGDVVRGGSSENLLDPVAVVKDLKGGPPREGLETREQEPLGRDVRKEASQVETRRKHVYSKEPERTSKRSLNRKLWRTNADAVTRSFEERSGNEAAKEIAKEARGNVAVEDGSKEEAREDEPATGLAVWRGSSKNEFEEGDAAATVDTVSRSLEERDGNRLAEEPANADAGSGSSEEASGKGSSKKAGGGSSFEKADEEG